MQLELVLIHKTHLLKLSYFQSCFLNVQRNGILNDISLSLIRSNIVEEDVKETKEKNSM